MKCFLLISSTLRCDSAELCLTVYINPLPLRSGAPLCTMYFFVLQKKETWLNKIIIPL